MFPGVFVNFALSRLSCLATARLATHPNTCLSVTLELKCSDEFFLAPGIATKIPLTLPRFIGVMVSRKKLS